MITELEERPNGSFLARAERPVVWERRRKMEFLASHFVDEGIKPSWVSVGSISPWKRPTEKKTKPQSGPGFLDLFADEEEGWNEFDGIKFEFQPLAFIARRFPLFALYDPDWTDPALVAGALAADFGVEFSSLPYPYPIAFEAIAYIADGYHIVWSAKHSWEREKALSITAEGARLLLGDEFAGQIAPKTALDRSKIAGGIDRYEWRPFSDAEPVDFSFRKRPDLSGR